MEICRTPRGSVWIKPFAAEVDKNNTLCHMTFHQLILVVLAEVSLQVRSPSQSI